MFPEKYVRFDWAAKNLLRNKADFCVLEGLVSVLLNEKITIDEILESEANQEYVIDKFNRVDIKAKNAKGEIIIVEVQQSSEYAFLKRILYSVSKNITDHIDLGSDYQDVKKIYSINILYFNFGVGDDFLYHGRTTFTGVNTHDTLLLTEKQQCALTVETPEDIFPEYYIVRVNEFSGEAATPLEEWLDYLKNGRIKDDTDTPGLREARKKLQYMMMTKEEKELYFQHIDHLRSARGAIKESRLDGKWEGRAEGLAEGRAEGLAEGEAKGRAEGLAEGEAKGRAEGLAEGEAKGRAEGLAEGEAKAKLDMAKSMLEKGIDMETVISITGLTAEQLTMNN